MAVYTKTYVQCDLCEAQRELPMNGAEGFYRIEAQVSRLGASGNATVGDKIAVRASDICQSCFGALQEGEWSNLFFGERSSKPIAPPKPISPA